jgi:hypothetical protein
MSTKLGRPTASATRREASRRWGGGAPACNVRRSTTAVRAVDTARPVGDTRAASPRTARGRSAVVACDRSDMIEIQEPTDLVVNTEYEFCGMRRTEAQCFMGLGFDLGMRCFNHRGTGIGYVARHTLTPRLLQEDGAVGRSCCSVPSTPPVLGWPASPSGSGFRIGIAAAATLGSWLKGQGGWPAPLLTSFCRRETPSSFPPPRSTRRTRPRKARRFRW